MKGAKELGGAKRKKLGQVGRRGCVIARLCGLVTAPANCKLVLRLFMCFDGCDHVSWDGRLDDAHSTSGVRMLPRIDDSAQQKGIRMHLIISLDPFTFIHSSSLQASLDMP